MATRRIETTIALDGEQAFKKGLAAAAREMRVLESESKALAASFGTSGDAAAAAAAKQRNLQNQVAQQEQIVSALEQAVKDAAKAYGESSAEVDGYAIKLNNARTRLANLQKALTSSDREVEELGRDAIKAGRQIEEGIGDGAREAENELTDLMATMQDSLSAIQSNTAVTAIKTVWDMASGAYNAVDGFVSGTVDYRRQLSFLELNADENGFDFSDIKTKLIEVTTVTGDASSSIETLSNLMAVPGIDTNTLTRAIEGLGGAVISFPETMKFESLADSLQETLASGTATGQFAELLNRLRVDVTAFNTALANSPTAAGDLEIALGYLAAGGLNDVYTKWQDTNEEMSDAMKTQTMIEDELAEFAGTLEKYVTTPVKDVALNAIQYINAVVAAAEGNAKALEDNPMANSAVGLVAAAKAVAANPGKEILGDFAENARYMFEGLWAGSNLVRAGEALEDSEFKKALEAFQKEHEPERKDAEELKKTPIGRFVEWWGGLFTGDKDASEEAKKAGSTDGQQYAAGFEEALDVSLWGEGKEAQSHKIVTIMPIEALENELDSAGKAMKDGGKEAGAELMEGLEEGSEGAATAGMAEGAAFGGAFAAGLTSQVSYVAASAGALAAAAAAAARAVSAPSVGVSGGLNLALNIDGKTFARATAPYMSGELAVNP